MFYLLIKGSTLDGGGGTLNVTGGIGFTVTFLLGGFSVLALSDEEESD